MEIIQTVKPVRIFFLETKELFVKVLNTRRDKRVGRNLDPLPSSRHDAKGASEMSEAA